MQSVWSAMEKLVRDARSNLENERKAAERHNELISHGARLEITRLKEQNTRLTELLDNERKNAMKSRDELVKRVSSLLVGFAEERDHGLREAVFGIQESNTQGTENMDTLVKKHDVLVTEAGARSRAWNTSLDKLTAEGGQAKQSAKEVRHRLCAQECCQQPCSIEYTCCKHIGSGRALKPAEYDGRSDQVSFRRNHPCLQVVEFLFERSVNFWRM